MRLPTGHGAELLLRLHILEEGHHAAKLRHHSRLQAGCIVIFDQPTEAFVDHVTDLHGIK
jgi:hypothetical protein